MSCSVLYASLFHDYYLDSVRDFMFRGISPYSDAIVLGNNRSQSAYRDNIRLLNQLFARFRSDHLPFFARYESMSIQTRSVLGFV